MELVENIASQAAGLRRVSQVNRPIRVISVTGGKGGVGKTNVSANLAVALSNLGKKVMLLDADLGLANIDVVLGLNPRKNLSHVISGECSLDDIVITGPAGISVVPAASGIQSMVELDKSEQIGLIRAFSELNTVVDVLVIDNAAGISDSVANFCKASQEVIIVVCDEPASITDAYATIKMLSKEHGVKRFHVLANMTKTVQDGRDLYEKLHRVTDRFLDVTMSLMGVIPYDDCVKKSVQKQKAVVEAFPRSRAALAFKNLAQKADKWPMSSNAAGHLVFFLERLIKASQETMEATI